jgi:hypothetical protein
MPTLKRQSKLIPAARPDPQLSLPKRFRLTAGERAVAARFVRAAREGHYWMPVFIEWLLALEAQTGLDRLDPVTALKAITMIASEHREDPTIRGFRSIVRKLTERCPGFSPCSNLGSGGPLVADVEDEFMELVQLWRKEYPEPPKPRQIPSGHLGRKDDDD